MAQQAASSSLAYKWTYDVFLSFRGEDTRLNFIGHLYDSLRQSGIHSFIDDESLWAGEEIKPSLLRAIQESRIAIIVFSENYASSTFCLDELAEIMDCFKEEGRLVYPVFYYVDPSEVRHQTGSYGEALAHLQKRLENTEQKLQKWRLALSEAANLSGWHLKPGIAKEQEYIKSITSEVSARINRIPLHVTDYSIGLESRVREVISLLDIWSDEEVKMVGICGIGGIGKSTIARGVCNSVADHFEDLCFLSNVRELSSKQGLSHLQGKLLYEIIKEKKLRLGDLHRGISIIKHRLQRKKILLILDDVDKLEQLRALAGTCDWFGRGSRIIITTRNKQLLAGHGVERIYNVKELSYEESLQLISWNAFKKRNLNSEYVDVLNRAVLYSCGLPLVLEVIGSNLCGKSINEWNSGLDQYETIPNSEIFEVLKLSFDGLEEKEKEIFLDLACFLKGEKLEEVKGMLQSLHEIPPEYAIGVLVDKSLVNIRENRLTMHDLIEDMDKEIVRRQSPNEPGERSRLWCFKDILHILQETTGTKKIQVMILDLPQDKEVRWNGKGFMKMKNLKVLVVKNACFSQRPKYLPNSLRVLVWKGYPFKFLPSDFHPTKLVYINLSDSYCHLLPFVKMFESLSCMDFKNCKFLRQMPDLSGASNLRELWLDGCTNLIQIHESVGFLNNLRELSAMKCKSLRILPSSFTLTSLECLNFFGCSSLQSFPQILDKMEKMKVLELGRIAVQELPSSICNLVGLEILNMEECHHLKRLPVDICMLPNLCKLRANFCVMMNNFEMGQGGEQRISNPRGLSLTHVWFSNCNLSNGFLAFGLSYLPNLIHLDLSFNNFTTLPACIEDCHYLNCLLLDNCKLLKYIDGVPPNLEKFSATCCPSLSQLSRSLVLKQVFSQQPGRKNFILPGKTIPEWFHKYSRGCSPSFWVREEFPLICLCFLIRDDRNSVGNYTFSLFVDGIVMGISSACLPLSEMKPNHLYVCDLQSMIPNTKLPLPNNWKRVEISIKDGSNSDDENVYCAVHTYKNENNRKNISFTDPNPTMEMSDAKTQPWGETKRIVSCYLFSHTDFFHAPLVR